MKYDHEKGLQKKKKKKMIVMVPYPAQGHVTPMLQLATGLVHHGFHPVVVTPGFIHRKINPQGENAGVSFLSIPDGLDEDAPCDFFAIEEAMEDGMATHLERLIRKLEEDEEEEVDGGGNVACVVVDLLCSYAIGAGERCGLPVVGFWAVMLAAYRLIAAIPYMLHAGLVSEIGTPQFKGRICIVPGQPKLGPEDLPWLIGTSGARIARFKFWIRTLHRSSTLRWLLGNSSSREEEEEEEEEECHDHCEPKIRLIDAYDQEHTPFILPVGPLSKHTLSYKNTTFWEEDMTCLEWLEKQKAGSVVYVSFGSWVSPIGEGKIKSLALALEASKRPFIWVLGLLWREGLPQGYIERVEKQGKVVSWAPQMEVLRHEAVGFYLTHCGWNSTNEAIQCMKPLVCYPVAGDQFVNCAYITDVWKIGVKIGGLGRKDVEEGFRRVLEDGKMKESLLRLNGRIMGKAASLSATNDLKSFIDDLEK